MSKDLRFPRTYEKMITKQASWSKTVTTGKEQKIKKGISDAIQQDSETSDGTEGDSLEVVFPIYPNP